MRPATWLQRPPAYAMPTTSQSAIGRCSAVSASVEPSRGEGIDVGEDGRRDERHGQPAERAGVEPPLPDEVAGQQGQHEETQSCGRRSRRPASSCDPEERRHLDERRPPPPQEQKATMASVRAARLRLPGIRGTTTSCFQRRSECSRANSRERASRSPMRFTATRNASSVASPASTRHRDLLAQMVFQLRYVDGVDRLPAAEVAPPLVDLLLERYRVIWSRHRSGSLWQWRG